MHKSAVDPKIALQWMAFLKSARVLPWVPAVWVSESAKIFFLYPGGFRLGFLRGLRGVWNSPFQGSDVTRCCWVQKAKSRLSPLLIPKLSRVDLLDVLGHKVVKPMEVEDLYQFLEWRISCNDNITIPSQDRCLGRQDRSFFVNSKNFSYFHSLNH